MNQRKDSLVFQVFTYAVLIVFIFIAIYPILRMISISLRPNDRLLSTSLALIPDGATLKAYKTLLFERPFLRWLGNSLLVTGAVTILGVTLASMAGYAFSRFKFFAKQPIMLSLLVTQMFPPTMLLLPTFLLLAQLRLVNSFFGLMIVYTATALPFCIWQMKGFYDTIPHSLEEAALIDGATPFQAWRMVILPLAAPALVITALFSFMSAWSEYVVAAQILIDVNKYTLPLGLKMFQASMGTEWAIFAAASTLISIPVMVLFLMLSKWLISGLTLGSVKE
ncbi:MAG: ABC transporter permease subunit [bacterium]|nr:ABC transporter permease subunit [bacterium]